MAQVPRVRCPEHGIYQVPVPWAENNRRLTALFEALVIDWLKIGTISEVAECSVQCRLANQVPTGALLLVSDQPILAEGGKTEANDRKMSI